MTTIRKATAFDAPNLSRLLATAARGNTPIARSDVAAWLARGRLIVASDGCELMAAVFSPCQPPLAARSVSRLDLASPGAIRDPLWESPKGFVPTTGRRGLIQLLAFHPSTEPDLEDRVARAIAELFDRLGLELDDEPAPLPRMRALP
jgi:hypothetical protein